MNGQFIRTLTGHEKSLYRSLDLINEDKGQILLLSGSKDQSIRKWQTGECKKKFKFKFKFNLFIFKKETQYKKILVLKFENKLRSLKNFTLGSFYYR